MRVEYRAGLDHKPGRAELDLSDGSLILWEWKSGKQVVLWSAQKTDVTTEIEAVSGAWQESRSFKRGIFRAGKKHGPLSSVSLSADGVTIVAQVEATPAEIRANLGL